MNYLKLVLSICLLALFISCDIRSGEQYFERRELEGVSRLKLNGAFNINISQEDQPALTIQGNPKLAEKLEVIQKGDVLELRIKDQGGNFSKKNGLQISLAVLDLKELEFEGAGVIKTTHPLDLTDFRLIGNGVGNVELALYAINVVAELNFVGNMVLKGEVDEFRIRNEGVGNINASKFKAKNIDLNSSGIGKVSIHCENELSLVVDGIGLVSYTGNPTVIHEQVSGIAKVIRN